MNMKKTINNNRSETNLKKLFESPMLEVIDIFDIITTSQDGENIQKDDPFNGEFDFNN